MRWKPSSFAARVSLHIGSLASASLGVNGVAWSCGAGIVVCFLVWVGMSGGWGALEGSPTSRHAKCQAESFHPGRGASVCATHVGSYCWRLTACQISPLDSSPPQSRRPGVVDRSSPPRSRVSDRESPVARGQIVPSAKADPIPFWHGESSRSRRPELVK